MAEPPSDPPEDIPAWFMTYSDVITLADDVLYSAVDVFNDRTRTVRKGRQHICGRRRRDRGRRSPTRGHRSRFMEQTGSTSCGSDRHAWQRNAVDRQRGSVQRRRGRIEINRRGASEEGCDEHLLLRGTKLSDLVDEHEKLTQRGIKVRFTSSPVSCATCRSILRLNCRTARWWVARRRSRTICTTAKTSGPGRSRSV